MSWNEIQKQPPEVFYKIIFWKNSQNSQDDICVRVSFLITLQPCEACNFIKKETSTQVFSCEVFKIFKYTIFTEHLPTTASWNIIQILALREKNAEDSIGRRFKRIVLLRHALSSYVMKGLLFKQKFSLGD